MCTRACNTSDLVPLLACDTRMCLVSALSPMFPWAHLHLKAGYPSENIKLARDRCSHCSENYRQGHSFPYGTSELIVLPDARCSMVLWEKTGRVQMHRGVCWG